MALPRPRRLCVALSPPCQKRRRRTRGGLCHCLALLDDEGERGRGGVGWGGCRRGPLREWERRPKKKKREVVVARQKRDRTWTPARRRPKNPSAFRRPLRRPHFRCFVPPCTSPRTPRLDPRRKKARAKGDDEEEEEEVGGRVRCTPTPPLWPVTRPIFSHPSLAPGERRRLRRSPPFCRPPHDGRRPSSLLPPHHARDGNPNKVAATTP